MYLRAMQLAVQNLCCMIFGLQWLTVSWQSLMVMGRAKIFFCTLKRTGM